MTAILFVLAALPLAATVAASFGAHARTAGYTLVVASAGSLGLAV